MIDVSKVEHRGSLFLINCSSLSVSAIFSSRYFLKNQYLFSFDTTNRSPHTMSLATLSIFCAFVCYRIFKIECFFSNTTIKNYFFSQHTHTAAHTHKKTPLSLSLCDSLSMISWILTVSFKIHADIRNDTDKRRERERERELKDE